MLIMRITDFIRECFCWHEWIKFSYYPKDDLLDEFNYKDDLCLKCGKIK